MDWKWKNRICVRKDKEGERIKRERGRWRERQRERERERKREILSIDLIIRQISVLTNTFFTFAGVRPYKCERCDKSFTQRCSLESHLKKVHGETFNFKYKERRSKVYVCEDCGHTTPDPEDYFVHLKQNHPHSPAILKCYDKRQFKFDQKPDASKDQQQQQQQQQLQEEEEKVKAKEESKSKPKEESKSKPKEIEPPTKKRKEKEEEDEGGE